MSDQFLDDRMFVVCVCKYIGHGPDRSIDNSSDMKNIILKICRSAKGHPFYTNYGTVDSDTDQIDLMLQVSDEEFASFKEEHFDDKWGVLTFRNVQGYPPVRVDLFDTEEEAVNYLIKVAPEAPRVSLKGRHPYPVPTFEELQDWLVSIGEKKLPYYKVNLSENNEYIAPISLRNRAIELFDEKRFREALILFQKIIQTGCFDWGVFYMAGQCCRFINDLDGAIGYLNQADKLNPDDSTILLALGIALQLKECFHEAIEKFRKAIEVDPDFELAYNSLALTQKKIGELEKALHNYDAGAKALTRRIVKAMRNEPSNKIFKHKDINYNLWLEYASYGALYLTALNEDVQAIGWEEEERAELHKGLYWIDSLTDDGKPVRVILSNYFNTFRETLGRDSAYANLIGNRGTVLKLLGRNKEAQKHFDEASYFLPTT